jgi:hypothetical protein
MRTLPPAFLVLASLAGCAAGRNVYYVWDAQRALKEAELVDAPKKAVYEYTLASEYLSKAKEEAGYSDFGASEKLARKATEWAAKAADVAEYGSSDGDKMLREADEGIPDQKVEKPATPPPPPEEDLPIPDLDLEE